jgi:putative flippase GtrA
MSSTQTVRAQRRAERGERFTAVMTAIAGRLPFGLSRVVAPSMLGFAVINGCTFGIDMTLLTIMHSAWHWLLAISITVSYATAFALSFVLNRAFNFRSHSAVGRQLAIYVVVVIVNYLAFILGVGAGLTALRVDYRIARVAAGVCEAIYMYAAMRWVVFRDRPTESA